MKIKSIEVMILKITPKVDKEGKSYNMVSIAVLEDGTVLDLIVKEKSILTGLEPFSKTVLDFDLTSTKYGLSLKVV